MTAPVSLAEIRKVIDDPEVLDLREAEVSAPTREEFEASVFDLRSAVKVCERNGGKDKYDRQEIDEAHDAVLAAFDAERDEWKRRAEALGWGR